MAVRRFVLVKISVVVLTQNNEKTIARCLNSVVSFADEIIVVDSFSTDETKKICTSFSAKVFSKKFVSTAESRNFGLHKTKNDWVFFIDSDEAVSKELSKSLSVFSPEKGVSAFSVFIKTKYLAAWMKSRALNQWQPRLLKKGFADWGNRLVHSPPRINRTVSRLDGALLHYSIRSIAEQLKKIDYYACKEARQKKLLKQSDFVLFFPFFAFFDFVFVLCKRLFFEFAFFDGWRGIFFAFASAYYFALADYKFFFKKF